LGCAVTWEPASQTVVLSQGSTVVTVVIGGDSQPYFV
jgi:hypothetical protein